ncbi:phage holin family protein [Fusobacterium animalis]|uniref:phage holin family protein n=1 Tax=Fusobacterium animalis TaxID=76859 RepID=UPI001C6F01F1|nr:phage holin family protein [Fusobacterium animalis]QYR65716.1 phage holin family protein [Fusobacterium animalis]
MEKEKGIIKFFIIIGSYLSYFIGDWSISMEVMFIFMACDYITGYLRSLLKKKLSSKTGYKGLIKKTGYIFAVVVGAALDRLIIANNLNVPITILGFPISFKIMMICSVVGTEGISIVENLKEMGLIVPFPVRKLFKQLRQEDTNEEIKNKEP